MLSVTKPLTLIQHSRKMKERLTCGWWITCWSDAPNEVGSIVWGGIAEEEFGIGGIIGVITGLVRPLFPTGSTYRDSIVDIKKLGVVWIVNILTSSSSKCSRLRGHSSSRRWRWRCSVFNFSISTNPCFAVFVPNNLRKYLLIEKGYLHCIDLQMDFCHRVK